MDDALYREEILDHYHSSRHRGRLDAPDIIGEADNPFCGDRIRIELKADSVGRICTARFDGQGCAISQAAASMLCAHMEGKTFDQAYHFSPDEMLHLLGVRLSATRMKCGLLALHVLKSALKKAPDEHHLSIDVL